MGNVIKDKASTEWIAVKGYCKNRLNELREENDTDKDATETARLRGMIELAKEILDLDEDSQHIQVGDTKYIS